MKIALMIGKWSGIHKDHVKSISGMKEWADANGAECRVYTAMSADEDKQPIPFERKMFYLRAAVDVLGVEVMPKPMSAWEAIEDSIFSSFKSDGERGVYVFTGSDHLDEYAQLMDGIKKRYLKKGRTIDFPTEVVQSAGRVGGKGISGTDVRRAIKDDDFETFEKLCAMPDSDLARQMFDEYRMAYYKLEERMLEMQLPFGSKHQRVVSNSLTRVLKPRPELKWPGDEEKKDDDNVCFTEADAPLKEMWLPGSAVSMARGLGKNLDAIGGRLGGGEKSKGEKKASCKKCGADFAPNPITKSKNCPACDRYRESTEPCARCGRSNDSDGSDALCKSCRKDFAEPSYVKYFRDELPKQKSWGQSLSDDWENLKAKWRSEDESERFRKGESMKYRESEPPLERMRSTDCIYKVTKHCRHNYKHYQALLKQPDETEEDMLEKVELFKALRLSDPNFPTPYYERALKIEGPGLEVDIVDDVCDHMVSDVINDGGQLPLDQGDRDRWYNRKRK